MSDSEKTRLPPTLMASLYRDSLIRSTPSEGKSHTEAPSGMGDPSSQTPALGGFGKSVLVLVSHPGGAVMPDAELAFITNILKACRLGMEDVLLANAHGMDAAERKSFAESRRAAFLVLFGLEPADVALPMSFPPMKVQRHGQSQYLHAPALRALQTDDAGKRMLWGALRQMFGIS